MLKCTVLKVFLTLKQQLMTIGLVHLKAVHLQERKMVLIENSASTKQTQPLLNNFYIYVKRTPEKWGSFLYQEGEMK